MKTFLHDISLHQHKSEKLSLLVIFVIPSWKFIPTTKKVRVFWLIFFINIEPDY